MGKEAHSCAAMISPRGSWYKATCSKAGKYREVGLWWCKTHLPSNVAEKNAKRDARWKHNDRIADARSAVKSAEHDLVMAAVDAKADDVCCDSIGDAVDGLLLAQDALVKLKGEA